MSAKHRVTVNLDGREYSELAALSEKNVSLAWLGRQAIIELLDHYGAEELQLPLNLSSREARPGVERGREGA